MSSYNIKLKENELQIINYISTREDKRKKLQSIYQYVIKHTTLNGGHFIVSNKDFHDMYSRYHYKMKADTFRKFLDLLTKFGLIIKKKYKNVNVFTVNRGVKFNPSIFFESEVPNNVLDNISYSMPTPNIAESVDITSFQVDNDLPNNNIESKDSITIIDKANIQEKTYKKLTAYKLACIKNNKDTVPPIELVLNCIKKLKKQGKYSEKIINRIRKKLMFKLDVVRINMDKYLDVVVADAIAFYEVSRDKVSKIIATKKVIYDKVYNTKKNIATSNFDNFTQREYDYNALENYLLGYSDYDEENGFEL